MKRTFARRGLDLLAALVFTTSLTAWPASADEPALFAMSKTSVRAGEATMLTEVTPCPAPTNDFPWDQHVKVLFTDANGEVSQSSVLLDDQGHWTAPIWMTSPHTRVLSFDPVTYSSGAALGQGTVQAWCEEDGVTTLEYESHPLTISGPSAGFKISSGFLKTGKSVHLESTTPCPAGSASMDGWLDVNTIGFPFSAELDADGGWSVNFVIPADFPLGMALIDVFCRPPGEPNGSRTQVYTQSFAKVKAGKFNYLAWGDSYTSGDGVEPFEAGTEGESGCRRSVNAYPRLLERDPALSLELGAGFVACQGATTSSITAGHNGQGAQIDTLTADTDLVTMTLSGNDMPFGEFAFSCIAPPALSAPCDGQAQANAMAGIVNNVIPNVRSAMEAIGGRISTLGGDTTVLVLGYPYLVPESVPLDTPLSCSWLDPGELSAIRHVIRSLNIAIKNEVEAIGGNFHFVSAIEESSPFRGHELCRETADPTPAFFRDFDPFAPRAYTAHPTDRVRVHMRVLFGSGYRLIL